MRRLLAAILIFGFAVQAGAATDAGDGQCVQDDGAKGLWNGSSADDEGCTTTAEYETRFSAPGLLENGVIEDYTVNSDGTTTLDFGNVKSTVKSNPLDRPVAASSLDPDAPTVREWFGSWPHLFG